MNKPNRSPCAGLAGFLVVVASGALSAQTAPVPSLAPPATAGAEVVEISPFAVNTSRDIGYPAENTLAGSRLNSPLRDTAGSVSVFTREFLDDLAISDVRELVAYSVNAEMNTNENQAGNAQ